MEHSVRILHTADTHLGYRQYHSDVRHRDFFGAFERVIDDAVSMPVDAVVHAGDFFDSRNPSLDDLITTIGILSKLKDAGIPFYGIVGNHEGKQNSQWLDLFEEMGLAFRLSEAPFVLTGRSNASKDGAASVRVFLYGIDNLSAPRFRNYDFSLINENAAKTAQAHRLTAGGEKEVRSFSLLVLHQLLHPVLPGRLLSVYDFLDRIRQPFDAVLLGDNHSYECIRIPARSPSYAPGPDGIVSDGDSLPQKTWVTYPGSTERCSAAEEEPRAYNLLELTPDGLSIVRRSIPTRPFVVIPVPCEDAGASGAAGLMRTVLSKIDDHREKLPGAVVFVELDGMKDSLISFAEIEEYILRYGAVVAKVSDRRDVYTEDADCVTDIAFLDPDEVVRSNLKRLNLTEAGFLVDGIIRDLSTAKTRIDDQTDERLRSLMDSLSFDTRFRRDGPLLIAGDSTDVFSEQSRSNDHDAPDGPKAPETVRPENEGENGKETAVLPESVGENVILPERVEENVILSESAEENIVLPENGEETVVLPEAEESPAAGPSEKADQDKSGGFSGKERGGRRDFSGTDEKEDAAPRQYTLSDLFG